MNKWKSEFWLFVLILKVICYFINMDVNIYVNKNLIIKILILNYLK